MTKKRFRLDLSRPILIILALSVFILSAIALNSLNMPSPDYSGIDELKIFVHRNLSLVFAGSIVFIGVLGGYHIALKVLEEEKEGRGKD